MSETNRIVALSRRAIARGEELCLATVVHVEGSAYRKPGARLLLTSSGEHAGTISGGCLEAEVTRKAWWLTANGPSLERYSSFADEDGGMPYGLGCGGTVSLLLEQGEPVLAVLDALARGADALQPSAIIMALRADVPGGLGTLAVFCSQVSAAAASRLPADRSGMASGHVQMPPQHAPEVISGLTPLYLRSSFLADELAAAARSALASRSSSFLDEAFLPCRGTPAEGEETILPAYRVEYLAPPPALSIFGAGDDAQPLAEFAHALGWRVTVADGRAHFARRDRFPQASSVRVLDYSDPSLRAACGIPSYSFDTTPGTGDPTEGGFRAWLPPDPAASASLVSDDLAVVLTHSYEQDRALLAALLPRDLRYLGILGPRHRTERLLAEVTPALGLSLEEGFARLHSPVGLDLGAGDPAAVALSIIAQIQAVLHNRHVTIARVAESPARESLPQESELVPDLHG